MITIHDEILKITVHLAICSSKDFVDYLNRYFKDSEFPVAIAEDYSQFKIADGYSIGGYYEGIYHAFIWLAKYDESAYWLSVLSHECNEATKFIFEIVFQEEKYTHTNIRYQDELFETCLKKIRGKNEKNNNNNTTD